MIKKIICKTAFILKDKRGLSFPIIIGILVAGLIIASFIIQIGTIYVVTGGVNDEVQGVLTDDVENNISTVYYGMRAGTTAAYVPDGQGGWTDETTTARFYSDIQSQLGLNSNMQKIDSSGGLHYTIADLHVTIHNPAVGDPSSHYSETATYTLEVPYIVAGSALPSFKTNLSAKSGITNEF